MIIGFSGYARAGKDTAAAVLVDLYGFRRLSFADPLKSSARTIFSLNDDQLFGEAKEVVDPYWGVTPRYIMQRLGTECLRDGFDKDVWVKALFRKISDAPHDHFVIPDVRFPNEAAEIQRWGGRVVRIERPAALGAEMLHASEHALDGWAFDRVIGNYGSLTQLAADVAGLVKARDLRAA